MKFPASEQSFMSSLSFKSMIKREFTQKRKFCHNLLVSFQTCVTFFLLWILVEMPLAASEIEYFPTI